MRPERYTEEEQLRGEVFLNGCTSRDIFVPDLNTPMIALHRSTVALKVNGVWWNEKAGEKYLQDSVDNGGDTP